MKVKVIVLIMSVLLVACGSKDKKEELNNLKSQYEELGKKIKVLEQEIGKAQTQGNERIFAVDAQEVKKQEFNHFVEVQGKVDGEENVTVTSKTIGVISSIFVKEGDMVKKGQVLAQFDNAIIQKGLAELRANQAFVNDLYEKQKKLWDQKIGSEVQYLTAKNNKEGLDLKVKTMEEQLDMYNIESPINGTVEEVPVKVGQSVGPGAIAFRIVNLATVKITAEVSESYSVKIHQGDDVKINFPDNNETTTARISFASKYINPTNRTFLVEAKLDPGKIEFRANMIAVMEIVDYTVKDAVTIPVNIMQADNTGKYIFVIENTGSKMIAKKRNITIGRSYNGNVEVISGLKEGEKVINTGFQNLEDGVTVTL